RIVPAWGQDVLGCDSTASAAERQSCPQCHEGLSQMFDDTRQGREPKPPAHRFAETARCDEDEPPDSLRTLEQEHLRDAPAERMTDDVRLLDPDHFQPARDDVSVPVECITGIRA